MKGVMWMRMIGYSQSGTHAMRPYRLNNAVRAVDGE
jgi:hypothetical protein